MATLLNVDGSRQIVHPASPPHFTLEELQTLVGGYIEVVSLEQGKMLIINEDGKFIDMEYNEQATKRAQGYLFLGDYIVGPAVEISEQEMSK